MGEIGSYVYNSMIRGNRHEVTIDGKTFWVDSNQEEALIRWLEDNGFHDRWLRRDYGVSVGTNNYTPDLELSIQLDHMTHRAIVESKPDLASFTPYVSHRMRGVAKHYLSDVLLLYVHDKNIWYRVDTKTGILTEFSSPTPGGVPIKKLYKPLTVRARNIYAHRYRKRPEISKKVARIAIDGAQSLLIEMLGAKKKKRRRFRRK